MAFNLIRAAATLTARIASSAPRLHVHLPEAWPWRHAWIPLYNAVQPRRALAPT